MNRALQRAASPYNIVKAVRRNHGIEHGTVTVLLEQGFSPPMGGNATPSGFYIYSGASADKVEAAAMEALSRMAAGEGELAVSPYCGTNLVVSALVAAVGAYLAARVSGSRRPTFSALLWGALASAVFARPLGALVQKHCTTLPDVEGVEIVSVTHRRVGPVGIHKFETAGAAR